MNVGWPTSFAFVLLALAAYRVTRLIGWDDITDGLRRRATGLGDWAGGDLPPSYRPGLDKWLHCPFCLGWWVALGWWAAWAVWPEGTMAAATPFAIAAVVGLIGKQLDA